MAIPEQLKTYELLSVDTTRLKSLWHAPKQHITFIIPADQRTNIVVELERTDQFMQHAVVPTAPAMR